ncbi:GTP cyclohydrolase II [Maritalea sp.]|uniref:GTP cyclohydrolase II n=1 Tax=Maritalea sp. TaxID=2003361 RepID=UPI003EF16E02
MTATIRQIVGVPLPAGRCDFVSFTGLADMGEHIALAYGDWNKNTTPLVRLHSECLTGDIFGSLKCDCGPQLEEAKSKCRADCGIILYLRQEGRGIGLYNKLDAYAKQEAGADTYEANHLIGQPAEARDFSVAAQMLLALGKPTIRLLSNNPDKKNQLEKHGIIVTQQVKTGVFPNAHNQEYLSSKQAHGHQLNVLAPQPEKAGNFDR